MHRDRGIGSPQDDELGIEPVGGFAGVALHAAGLGLARRMVAIQSKKVCVWAPM